MKPAEHRRAARLIRARASYELALLLGEGDARQRHRDQLHVQYARLYALVLAGREPAEVLPPELREDVVRQLHDDGKTDVEIATRTRMSTATVVRIRERIELADIEDHIADIAGLERQHAQITAGSPAPLPTTTPRSA